MRVNCRLEDGCARSRRSLLVEILGSSPWSCSLESSGAAAIHMQPPVKKRYRERQLYAYPLIDRREPRASEKPLNTRLCICNDILPIVHA